tara:strand:+ start:1346 stop:2128 length:783 start_codon:yes stop_codon:yes gene_type:complete
MKILVIGDSCTDIFSYGNIERISPEAPVPVFLPEYESENPGMAANVARNISSMGIDCDLITNNTIIEKIRLVDSKSNQMVVRVDKNDKIPDDDSFDFYINDYSFKGYDAIVISDYNKGFLSDKNINKILELNENTFLQTNKKIGEWCESANFLKINEMEYNNSKSYIDKKENLKDTNLIITLGNKGCLYKDKIFNINNKVEIRDLSGAGDTFLAGLVVEYLKSKNIEIAINFAQDMATQVVQKSGVNVAGKENKKYTKIN